MVRGLPVSDALRSSFGPADRVRRLHSSPRSRVWAADLGGRAVVVKQTVAGADAADRFAREVAALRMAARARQAVAAPLLAVDEDALLIVLGRVERAPLAPGWTVSYARALARLHATGTAADAGALPVWTGPTTADADAFCSLAGALGVPVPPGARHELTAAVDRVAADAAAHHALLHGDPCPGNDLHTADGPVFVDLEQAALGNGLVELAYLRVGFPTCWNAMALAPSTVAAAEDAYRAEWRALTGTPVAGDPADACLGWLIRGDALVRRDERGARDHLARAARRDFRWGPPSARERLLHRLAVVTGLTTDHPRLAAVGVLTAAMRTRMHARWPRLRALPADRDPRADG